MHQQTIKLTIDNIIGLHHYKLQYSLNETNSFFLYCDGAHSQIKG